LHIKKQEIFLRLSVTGIQKRTLKNIYGYAVELSDKGKPIAILYPHKVAQLIWIDMD